MNAQIGDSVKISSQVSREACRSKCGYVTAIYTFPAPSVCPTLYTVFFPDTEQLAVFKAQDFEPLIPLQAELEF
ncbi:MAG: hypothetical protein K8L97_31155 [Anaerolineae bacterium]|nr:hypothetical protein [Anaerolineae bacterium]